MEAGVLSLLRAAVVRYGGPPTSAERIELSPSALILGDDIRDVLTRGPEDNIRALTAGVVAFVESDAYLWFAERVEQAADDTPYDVWVAWDAAGRKQVIVRLAGFLGVGLRAATEAVEQDRPLARGVKALEVMDLAARYRQAGLSVRVSPTFRWRLP